jgi:alcohol dehydrogenase class IV
MERFVLPRNLCRGKGSLGTLKPRKGKKAIVAAGNGDIKPCGFLDSAAAYLRAADREPSRCEGPESDAALVDSGLALSMPPKHRAHIKTDAIARAGDAYVFALLLQTLLRPTRATMARAEKLVVGGACGAEEILRFCFCETIALTHGNHVI